IVAVGMVIVGFILVAFGILQKFKETENSGDSSERTSKGIVFIGPIPIAWGFSRRTQGILFIVALSLVIIWLLLIL
ncbi:MAG: DUF131 domain-containing protein, partial [Candidatus Thorarchaeota archaeon]|nr:DUF131 domain-containing protein [Candidatus Thorarchaeota archaeon]